MIKQELRGHLLTHFAISALICAATEAGIDPDRAKPTRTIRAVRRRVADPALSPDQRHRALRQVSADITSARNLNKRRERAFPASSNEDATTPTASRNQATTAPATTHRPPSHSSTSPSPRPRHDQNKHYLTHWSVVFLMDLNGSHCEVRLADAEGVTSLLFVEL
jgi:hypothetical protein